MIHIGGIKQCKPMVLFGEFALKMHEVFVWYYFMTPVSNTSQLLCRDRIIISHEIKTPTIPISRNRRPILLLFKGIQRAWLWHYPRRCQRMPIMDRAGVGWWECFEEHSRLLRCVSVGEFCLADSKSSFNEKPPFGRICLELRLSKYRSIANLSNGVLGFQKKHW